MSLAERLAALGIGPAAVLLTLLSRWLPSEVTVATALALVVSAALLLRRTWLWVFGPVFLYDLIRTSRRGRYFVVRCGYAGLLLAALFFYFDRWFYLEITDLFESSGMPSSSLAQFAEGFFTTFLVVQLLAVLILTPLVTAGAITEEKELRTFEYLLTTELDNREIVLGKLGARLGQLSLMVFTGLPVLSLLQFMGGVDPELVLATFLGTACTVLSTAALSMLVSVLCSTTTTAVFATYLCIGGYLVLTACLGGCAAVVPFLNLGNPYHAYARIAAADGAERLPIMFEVLLGYCGMHGLLALVCGILAVRELRGPALEPYRRKAPPVHVVPRSVDVPEFVYPARPRMRPPVGEHALLWKELNDRAIRMTEVRSGLFGCLAVLTVLGLAILGPILLSPGFWGAMQALNGLMRGLGTGLACLMLLLIAVNAAGRVSREWEKQTLAGLLTLPIDRGDILVSKWLASVLHVRGLWWVLGWCWLMAFLSGGPTLVGLPFLILGWWVYAAFVAVVGTWFSVVTRSTLRSILWTPLAALALPAGTWVYLEWMNPLLLRSGVDPGLVAAAERFQQYGLAPPMALWVLSGNYSDPSQSEPVLAALAGLGLYALATLLLWKATRRRFRALTDEVAEGAAPTMPAASPAK